MFPTQLVVHPVHCGPMATGPVSANALRLAAAASATASSATASEPHACDSSPYSLAMLGPPSFSGGRYVLHGGQQQPDQHRDDGDDDQQLDQGEGGSATGWRAGHWSSPPGPR